MNRFLLVVIITLALPTFSCGGVQSVIPSPTPTINAGATIKAAVNATLAAQPSNTPTPRPTRTKTPTSTSSSSTSSRNSLTFNAVLCLISLLFFLSTLLCIRLYLNRGKELKALKESLEVAKNDSDSQIQKLEDMIRKQSEDELFLQRKEWLESISDLSFHNEVEVEVKFIHPLVKFLGYKENEFELRVPVNLQLGHNSMKGEADWVLWDADDTSYERKAFIVIEAKAPGRFLDEFHAQVRSYAFSLDAPIYAITNGKDFQIFRRGIQSDNCVISCTVANLINNWPLIEETIGIKARSSG